MPQNQGILYFLLPCIVLKAANRTATEMGCFGSMVLIQFGPLSPAGPFWTRLNPDGTRLNPFGKRIGPCGDPEDHHKATADCIWLIGPYLCHIWPITIDVVWDLHPVWLRAADADKKIAAVAWYWTLVPPLNRLDIEPQNGRYEEINLSWGLGCVDRSIIGRTQQFISHRSIPFHYSSGIPYHSVRLMGFYCMEWQLFHPASHHFCPSI